MRDIHVVLVGEILKTVCQAVVIVQYLDFYEWANILLLTETFLRPSLKFDEVA